MSEAELIFTALAELSTRNIAQKNNARGILENKKAGIEGWKVAKRARIDFEKQTGKKVITSENFMQLENKQKKLKNK